MTSGIFLVIGNNGENLEIIEAIVTLAHHLDISVVAEGVETKRQLKTLKVIGCEFGQGYLFSKPLAAESVELFL